MRFTIHERKIKVPEDIKNYAEKKLGKLDRYFQEDSDVSITFSELKGRQTVEVTIKQSGVIFRAEKTTTDLAASIDEAVLHLERQIRKHKTRLGKRIREDAADKAQMQGKMMDEAMQDDEGIERRKKFVVKPMTVDEAIMQMELLEHQFFVFRNAEDGDTFSVIYKRTNGGFGLIESE
jgi:putative sigma-54 modulation protein